jgi:hypothetical protein
MPAKPVAPHPQIIPQQTEDLEEMLEESGEESVLDQKNKIIYSVGIFVTMGIIIATVTVFLVYLNAPKAAKQEVKKSELSTMTPTPTQKPVPVTLEVLNGSGVSGAASKGATKLTDKGYTVVSTGNAKKQATTQFFVSKTLPQSAIDSLLSDVSTLFGVSSSSGDLTDSTATARLILGTK